MASMLGDALKALVNKPATRRSLPPPPERVRSALMWVREDCTGCGLCAMECPADALEVTVIDRKAKRFVLKHDTGKCIYCGQCVVSCNRDAIIMRPEGGPPPAADTSDMVVVFGEEE